MSGSNQLPAISLDELERLIRLLGMLGSDFDAEVLAAARHAVRWVREHDTDWQTLLTPEPEPAVSGVVATVEADAQAEAEAAAGLAFRQGYDAGLKDGLKAMAVQAKAQAAATGMGPGGWNPNRQTFATMAQNSPGAGLSGLGGGPGSGSAASPQGPVRPPAAVPAGGWPAGSWQAVAQELLDQHAAVPGVLRSREEIFVTDILRRGFRSLTPAQEHWLRDIAGRNSLGW